MPKCRGCHRWVVSLFLLAVLASPVRAEKDKAPPGYAEAVAQALSELEAANYPEALEEFRRAHAIFPNARTFRGQGMVEFGLRHYAESVRFLEEALASKVKPLDGRQRLETEVLLSRARRYLGELVITTDPEFAILAIDGAAIDLKLAPRLQLEVGEHADVVHTKPIFPK